MLDELPPCAADVTSTEGLRRLAQDHPRRWHSLLIAHNPPALVDMGGATVAAALRDPKLGGLLPVASDELHRVRRERDAARRLIRLVGGRAMAEVDEELLAETRARLLDGDQEVGQDAVAGETTTRTISLLRKVARRWALAIGTAPVVAERAPPAPPSKRRKTRTTLPLWTLQRLLQAAWPEERVVLAFALGGGMAECEIRSLRRRDLYVARGPAGTPRGQRGRPGHPRPALIEVLLDVSPAGDPYGSSRVRLVPLPLWACDLVAARDAGMLKKQPHEFLFPNRTDPNRPRAGFRSLMERLRLRAVGPKGPTCSIADLRRCWQVVARQAGLPKEVVRQTWWFQRPAPGQALRGAPLDGLRTLAAHWVTLRAPVAQVIESPASLPRRAPKGCAAGESELGDPWEGWRPLPGSCR